MKMEAIGEGLTVGKSRLFETNAGIFAQDGDAYLVDPGIFPDEIDTIVAATRSARIRGIILTHSHWDHILGPEHIAGVPVIAHASAAAHLAADATEIARVVTDRLAAEGIARDAPFVVPHVDVKIGDALTLPLGKGGLRIMHAPGHCSDQIVVYDLQYRTLWAADMLSDIEIPFIEDAQAYRTTLERLLPLEVAALVPGHGNVTTDRQAIRARLTSDLQYLVDVEREVAALVQRDRSLDETRSELRDWPMRHPQINAKEHVRNIETIYRSLTGGAS
jgi:hydroxyacylglutathione hydrolase